MKYLPRQLDLLAVAVIIQSRKDMTYKTDTITHNPIHPKLRLEACQWWNGTGRGWAETLAPDAEIPEPEAWDGIVTHRL